MRSRPTSSPASDYTIIPVGRKAEGYFRFRGYTLGQAFNGFSDQPTLRGRTAIGDHVVDLFASGEVDKVELVYTRFISSGSQEVVLRPLVPLDRRHRRRRRRQGRQRATDPAATTSSNPIPTTILDTLLPRYVEARIYAALLNAAASEHAFRQRAMKSATDNADELIKSLSRIMNRARQDSITTEIMEIVGGAEALDSDDAEIPYLDLGDDSSNNSHRPTPAPPSERTALQENNSHDHDRINHRTQGRPHRRHRRPRRSTSSSLAARCPS